MSALPGERVYFKIQNTTGSYDIRIYRSGWYQGLGARLVDSFLPQAPVVQPACLYDSPSGRIECGNWNVTAWWDVPNDAVSGVYLARLGTATQCNHIIFVVRDDSGQSDVLLSTSDSTYQAYNLWGGNSLYVGSPYGRSVHVSYNRPFRSRWSETGGHNFYFAGEYPMVRFLERNGYDVSYTTSVDTHRRGHLIQTHKLFISIGHDEYWSQGMRDSVTAARDAGVHIAFFSANSIYWRVRFEDSFDGTNTPNRTVVCYKDSRNEVVLDPKFPDWTGTWRDTSRLGIGAVGPDPENSLLGVMYMVDPPTDFRLSVSWEAAALRFWRNTSVAQVGVGQTHQFTSATLGYEFDIDNDNGHRPAGLVTIMKSTQNVQSELKDFGSYTSVGTVQHSSTLYRAPSGALVFGAGTIQWAYGLDSSHDGPVDTPDPALQQATVNLFADMGVQPTTLMDGLVRAAASSDTSAPVASITAPVDTPVVGQAFTVNGTASDTGGGVVANVEVSVDGGSTWHPAAGSTAWSYTLYPKVPGVVTVLARAVDDSANLQLTPASVNVTAVDRLCPCTLFPADAVPHTVDSNDPRPAEVGIKWRSSINGSVVGIRFYKSASNLGQHLATLWTSDGTPLAIGIPISETASGWQTVLFGASPAVVAGVTYVASYFAPAGRWSQDNYYWEGRVGQPRPLSYPPLSVVPAIIGNSSVDGVPNGVINIGGRGFPTAAYHPSMGPNFGTLSMWSVNYFVDVVVSPDPPSVSGPPVVVTASPPDGATGVVVLPAGANATTPHTVIEVMFDRPIDFGSLVFSLSLPNGTVAPSTAAAGNSDLSVSIVPWDELQLNTVYNVSVLASFQSISMSQPYTWSFRTVKPRDPPGVCPCTLFGEEEVPGTPGTTETASLELGVRLQFAEAGYVNAVHFYKDLPNGGSHVVNFWRADGTLLRSASVGPESAQGWQKGEFAPIDVAPGQTYIASYFAPLGGYSYTPNWFTADVSYGPVVAPAGGAGNGVFKYGSASAFPDQTFQFTNYWVDVVFFNGTSGSSTSSSGATTGLDFPADYTGSIVGDADPSTWPLSSENPSSDTAAYELGTRFYSVVAGYVTAIRFFKAGATNAGPHTVSLWRADGTELTPAGGVAVASEPSSGWVTVPITPVAIDANVDYVASYFAPSGRYTFTSTQFASAGLSSGPLHAPQSLTGRLNGLFHETTHAFPSSSFNNAFYWVDAVFSMSANASGSTTGAAPATTALGTTGPSAPATTVAVATTGSAVFGASLVGDAVPSSWPVSSQDPASDSAAYELGTRFYTDVDGFVTAVRFYKSATNLGTHTVSLWTAGGTELTATGGVAVSSEPASGWVIVPIAPVAVTAGVDYVVSYFAPQGNYAFTSTQFSGSNSIDASPLHAPTSTVGRLNGLFNANAHAFPSSSFNDAFYWVDVVFSTSLTTGIPAPVTTAFATTGALPPVSLLGGAVPGDWPLSTLDPIENDPSAYELGTRFYADVNGSVTAIRFYKSDSRNAGPHTVSLWRGDGTELTSTGGVAVSSEPSSGWVSVSIAPVAIQAGVDYIASYYLPSGYYTATSAQFTSAGIDAAPLHAPGSSSSRSNGVFQASTHGFPASSYGDSFYWVDVEFVASA